MNIAVVFAFNPDSFDSVTVIISRTGIFAD